MPAPARTRSESCWFGGRVDYTAASIVYLPTAGSPASRLRFHAEGRDRRACSGWPKVRGAIPILDDLVFRAPPYQAVPPANIAKKRGEEPCSKFPI